MINQKRVHNTYTYVSVKYFARTGIFNYSLRKNYL